MQISRVEHNFKGKPALVKIFDRQNFPTIKISIFFLQRAKHVSLEGFPKETGREREREREREIDRERERTIHSNQHETTKKRVCGRLDVAAILS